MGYDLKQGAPNLFMTFGLGGVLLLSLLISFPFAPQRYESVSSLPKIPELGELWIPITATIVFAMHSLGSLMIAFGHWPVSRFAKHHVEADQRFNESLVGASDRLWALVNENRLSLRFMYGLTGIFQFHVILIAEETIRWFAQMDSGFQYDLSFVPIPFLGILGAIFYSSLLNHKLELMCLGVQIAIIECKLLNGIQAQADESRQA